MTDQTQEKTEGAAEERSSGASMRDGAQTDALPFLKEKGPLIVHYLFSASKTVQVHDLNNRATQRVLAELIGVLRELFKIDGRAAIRISVDFILINDVRITADPQNYGPFLYLIEEFKKRDIEGVEFDPALTVEGLGAFLKVLSEEVEGSDDIFGVIEKRMSEASIDHVRITQWVERKRELLEYSDEKKDVRKESNRVFSRTVALMKEVLRGIEQRHAIQVRKAKRLTQQMVDIIQADESILVGLASIKNFDEYTYAHSVNVCILSMLIADRLRLYKSDTARLGVSALLHDIGKTYIPENILRSTGPLSQRDWELMKYHTFFGVKELSRVKALREVTDAMFIAIQHHVHYNMNGYPQRPGGWNLRLFTRIVTVADYYDAMTTPRTYNENPVTPDQALRFILLKSGEIFDPFIAKVFIQAMGIYPIGTTVRLDTGEKGVVVKQNDDSSFLHRPLIRLLDANGSFSEDGEVVDLTEREDSETGYRRTVEKALYDRTVEQEKSSCFVSQ